MDIEDQTIQPTAPKRPRQTGKTRSPGAEASDRYRRNQRAKGVPTGAEMDTLLAETMLRLLLGRFVLTAEKVPLILKRTCRNAGWDWNNEAVRKALSERVKTIVARHRNAEDPAVIFSETVTVYRVKPETFPFRLATRQLTGICM